MLGLTVYGVERKRETLQTRLEQASRQAHGTFLTNGTSLVVSRWRRRRHRRRLFLWPASVTTIRRRNVKRSCAFSLRHLPSLSFSLITSFFRNRPSSTFAVTFEEETREEKIQREEEEYTIMSQLNFIIKLTFLISTNFYYISSRMYTKFLIKSLNNVFYIRPSEMML